jgi:hypothetical protein
MQCVCKNYHFSVTSDIAMLLQKLPKSGNFRLCIANERFMDLKSFVLSLVSKGKSCFTEQDALKETGIRNILNPWLGQPKWKQGQGRFTLTYSF